jgi:transposase-like protein
MPIGLSTVISEAPETVRLAAEAKAIGIQTTISPGVGIVLGALHNRRMMPCPHCQSKQTVKNGHRKGTQSYLCHNCGRQFRETHRQQGYCADVKEHCLKLYLNGLGFRAIKRVTGVNHNTVINWVKQADQALPDEDYEIPETAQVDELQTFVGSKKSKSGFGLP